MDLWFCGWVICDKLHSRIHYIQLTLEWVHMVVVCSQIQIMSRSVMTVNRSKILTERYGGSRSVQSLISTRIVSVIFHCLHILLIVNIIIVNNQCILLANTHTWSNSLRVVLISSYVFTIPIAPAITNETSTVLTVDTVLTVVSAGSVNTVEASLMRSSIGLL